jgi:hypothetical protein
VPSTKTILIGAGATVAAGAATFFGIKKLRAGGKPRVDVAERDGGGGQVAVIKGVEILSVPSQFQNNLVHSTQAGQNWMLAQISKPSMQRQLARTEASDNAVGDAVSSSSVFAPTPGEAGFDGWRSVNARRWMRTELALHVRTTMVAQAAPTSRGAYAQRHNALLAQERAQYPACPRGSLPSIRYTTELPPRIISSLDVIQTSPVNETETLGADAWAYLIARERAFAAGQWEATCFEDDGSACFPAGTMVSLPDGGRKPIEQFKPGDEVLGWSGNGDDKPISDTVAAVLDPEHADMIEIVTTGGTLRCTADHPVMTSLGWCSLDPAKTKRTTGLDVEQLAEGDWAIYNHGKGWTAELVMGIHRRPGPIQTYNLVLERSTAYFADGLAVHTEFTAESIKAAA